MWLLPWTGFFIRKSQPHRRENDMMKILRKGVILLVIFVAVVAGTSFLMNSQSTDNRSDMNDATLPEVMVKCIKMNQPRMANIRI